MQLKTTTQLLDAERVIMRAMDLVKYFDLMNDALPGMCRFYIKELKKALSYLTK